MRKATVLQLRRRAKIVTPPPDPPPSQSLAELYAAYQAFLDVGDLESARFVQHQDDQYLASLPDD